MTFQRGATLTTATTFGHADSSNLGPTAGNGFYKRWPDDLALLQELGITDIRFTLDWARLQPKPGAFDGAWADRFDQILAASKAIGLRVWATLHDGAEPKWVTNEGGLGDAIVAETWWPRFAEKVADRFGSDVVGWVPFAAIDPLLTPQAWRNTWTTLSNGEAPVVASVDATNIEHISSFLDTSDIIGVVLSHGELADCEPDDERLGLMRSRLREMVGEAAAVHTGRLAVTQFTPHHDDADVAGQIVATFVEALDAAVDDGVDLDVAFLDPAISGPDSPNGLLTGERVAGPAAEAYLPRVD